MSILPHCVKLVALLMGAQAACAQVAIPATPKNFTKRSLSDTGSSGGNISFGPKTPPAEAKVRYTTYISLSEPRQWHSADGKSLLGKLIAHDDIVVETPKGAAAPAAPAMPPNPTVVKDGKARLLVNSKPAEVALERLSQADRDFIENIRAAIARKAAAPAR